MDNYEQDLQLLKEQQKKKAISDLEAQQKQSLSNLDAELNTVKPTYYAKKDSANVQSQVAGKNFAEYLANSGRSNSGIGAQYEMSRLNNLQRSLNDLNTAEASTIADINRRKTDVNNLYQSGLASANAQIEADYITNLLNQRQLAWEREQQEKQFEYQKQQDAIANAQSRVSLKSSDDEKYNFGDGTINNEGNPYPAVGGVLGAISSQHNVNESKNKNFTQKVTDSINNITNNLAVNQIKKNSSNLSGEYILNASSNPSIFSSNTAKKWYSNNIGGKQITYDQLESLLIAGYQSGSIGLSDAERILKTYGIN